MGMRYRITGHARATVAGVDHQDMRSILTAAANHYYDELAKSRKGSRGSDPEMAAFCRSQLQILDALKASMDAEIDRINGRTPRFPRTKAERLRAVSEACKERILLEEVLDQAIAEYAAERAGVDPPAPAVSGLGGDDDG